MTSDGIEPPLSDLESEVLPLHHEAGDLLRGEVAEWSKALRPGRSLFGGVGSNPTLTTFF